MGCSGAKSPGWFDVSPKKFCMRPDEWAGVLLWWSCQSPFAHSCCLLNCANSFHGGMLKLNTKFDADSLVYLLSHFECDTCSLNGIYCPCHWLVQWSHHCSHMCIPVHSPWLPGYIKIVQTILIIFTMDRHFPDGPLMCIYMYKYVYMCKHMYICLYIFISQITHKNILSPV